MSIDNPLLFVGEVISGATTGAPLAADTYGNLISGLSITEITATSTATAATGADVLLTGMTVTPVAGTYMVWFSCDITSTAAGGVITTSIYVGGVQDTASVRKISPFDGGAASSGVARGCVAINKQVTVNGSQAIEIRWSSTNNGPTIVARVLNILRII